MQTKGRYEMPGGINEDQEGPVDGEWVDYTSPLHPCYGIEGTLNYPSGPTGETADAYIERIALDKASYEAADSTLAARPMSRETYVNKLKMADKKMKSVVKFIKS
jgi:hypothetical protein